MQHKKPCCWDSFASAPAPQTAALCMRMNKLLSLFLALSFVSILSHAEYYPRLNETKAGIIQNYESAEKLYSELVKYHEYFQYQYIEGSLCSKEEKHSECVALPKRHEEKLLPLFQALPLYLTQITKEALVTYIAFEECDGMQCVVDAVRYKEEPHIQKCLLSQSPTPRSECIISVKGNWYIRYQFLRPLNA